MYMLFTAQSSGFSKKQNKQASLTERTQVSGKHRVSLVDRNSNFLPKISVFQEITGATRERNSGFQEILGRGTRLSEITGCHSCKDLGLSENIRCKSRDSRLDSTHGLSHP